jgi:hypothetical protein
LLATRAKRKAEEIDETRSNQHDEGIVAEVEVDEDATVEEKKGKVVKVHPVPTPTLVLGLREEPGTQLTPVEGAEGPNIDVTKLSTGKPYTEEELAWMKQLNHYADVSSMIYRGNGWFQLRHIPRLRYDVTNPPTAVLSKLVDSAYYYWRESDTHAAGGFYQSLTKSETQMLLTNLRSNQLMEHNEPLL